MLIKEITNVVNNFSNESFVLQLLLGRICVLAKFQPRKTIKSDTNPCLLLSRQKIKK